jgi:hypothetical protein
MQKERKILKSWKEIASYLGVGIRTAQRWKDRRGLPVRQPNSNGRTAVLALAGEIDKWLEDGTKATTQREAIPPELTDIVLTDALWNRQRPKELEREIEVLLELGCLMAREDGKTVLSKVSGHALTLCKAESSGFSLLETDKNGAEIFRWTATHGRMEPFEGGDTPANFSPCGYTLERNSAQLFQYPEKFYSYLQPIAPISELLLIPMHSGNAWLGTIWVICHEKRRKFDAEDARLMTELGKLASAVSLRDS